MTQKERPLLAAEPRTVLGKKVRALRRTGKLPIHLFGHGDSVALQIETRSFERLRELRQTAGLIELRVSDTAQPEIVLIRHIERDPRTSKVQHIDFFRVRMNETLTAKVPLRLNGVAPAAKLLSGVVYLLQETVEIEALPDDLPEAVNVDAAVLIGFDSVVHARDLQLPPRVKLLTSPDEPLVKVQPPRVEEAATPAPTPTAAAPTPGAAGA